ncbi:MAG: glycosyl hydrolase family 8, partial [Pseudomonadota bacterium]
MSLPQQKRGNPLLVPTWVTYKERFIQSDGRVVDREDRDRTVSEGQAYAMLRAVMINDRPTFEQTLSWAEANLARPDDSLWAWHWGEAADGQWQILDPAFATDADIDAVTALILAARRWDCPAYLDLAKTKLDDIWSLGTVSVAADQRHLLPGPAEAFWKGDELV